MLVQLYPQPGAHPAYILGNMESGGKHRHVKCLLVQVTVFIRGKGDIKIAGFSIGNNTVGSATNELDIEFIFRPVTVLLVIFSGCAHVHVENGGFDGLLKTFFGDDGLFE